MNQHRETSASPLQQLFALLWRVVVLPGVSRRRAVRLEAQRVVTISGV